MKLRDILYILAWFVFLGSLAFVIFEHQQALEIQGKAISTLQDYVIEDLNRRIRQLQ